MLQQLSSNQTCLALIVFDYSGQSVRLKVVNTAW